MRVLMFSWEYPPRVVGGLARHVQEISRAMARTVEVHVVTGPAEGAGELDNDNGVWVHRAVPIGPNTDDFMNWAMQLSHGMLAAAARLIADDSPFDIVHAHDWLAAFAGASLKRAFGIPLIATVHATEWGRNSGLYTPIQNRISDIEWYLCYEAWRVIVCSEHMRREVNGIFGVPADKLRVIPNGVVAAQFEQANLGRFQHAFAAPGDDVILFVGRLVHEKGVQLLIEAMPRILARQPSAKLIVAGSGPAEGSLRELANALGLGGRVSMVGFVDDEARNALYRMARVAVVPSLYEPFGITALEAMAASAPLVAADTGGLSEIVAHGKNGWKFAPGSVEGLADTILSVMDNPERSRAVAEAAHDEVMQVYDWRAIAAKTVEVYEEVLAQSAAADRPAVEGVLVG